MGSRSEGIAVGGILGMLGGVFVGGEEAIIDSLTLNGGGGRILRRTWWSPFVVVGDVGGCRVRGSRREEGVGAGWWQKKGRESTNPTSAVAMQ